MPTKATRNSSPSAAPRIRRILVPLDFSGESRQALPTAIALAEKFEARIVLAHVVAPILQPTMPPALGVALAPMPVRGLRKQAATELHERGVKLIPPELYERSIVTMGHAASEIVAIAARIDADLIVLTTHGHSGMKRFLMGSTAEQVVRHAKCPVMTVRRGGARAPKKSALPKRKSRNLLVPPMRAL
jgi:universal stress protein A